MTRSATSERPRLSRRQSFLYVQASKFACHPDRSQRWGLTSPRQPWRLHPSRTYVVTFIRIGYASRPNRAIDDRGTLTPSDSQPCRLLLPGSWAVLFVRAAVEDPAGCKPPLAHGGEVTIAFRQSKTLGTRNEIAFVAAWPTAHTFAHLRIAGRVATHVARLATDPGGLTPGRAGFAPAGRQTKFHEVIAYSTPLRPACPGRT